MWRWLGDQKEHKAENLQCWIRSCRTRIKNRRGFFEKSVNRLKGKNNVAVKHWLFWLCWELPGLLVLPSSVFPVTYPYCVSKKDVAFLGDEITPGLVQGKELCRWRMQKFRDVLLSSPAATQGDSPHPSGPCLSLVEQRQPFFGFSKVGFFAPFCTMESLIIAGSVVNKRLKQGARRGKKGKFSKYDFGHL